MCRGEEGEEQRAEPGVHGGWLPSVVASSQQQQGTAGIIMLPAHEPADELLVWLQDQAGPGVPQIQLPLHALYARCMAIHQFQDKICSITPSTSQHQQQLLQQQGAQAVCRAFAAGVEAAGLFSSNEDAEDVATADLKYMQASYILAELLTSSSSPEVMPGQGPCSLHSVPRGPMS